VARPPPFGLWVVRPSPRAKIPFYFIYLFIHFGHWRWFLPPPFCPLGFGLTTPKGHEGGLTTLKTGFGGGSQFYLFIFKKALIFFLKKICGSHVSADVATYVVSGDKCRNFKCVRVDDVEIC
jgi:hypothetical protein